MNKIAIYPGTFDPITYGHTDLIQKGLKVVDKLIASSDGTRDVLVPQYRYRIGYPICIPKNYWDKLSLLGTNAEFEIDQETLDPLSYIKISDISMKKLWFQYLNPIDIDEEKDR